MILFYFSVSKPCSKVEGESREAYIETQQHTYMYIAREVTTAIDYIFINIIIIIYTRVNFSYEEFSFHYNVRSTR